jgi:hypothetical protein
MMGDGNEELNKFVTESLIRVGRQAGKSETSHNALVSALNKFKAYCDEQEEIAAELAERGQTASDLLLDALYPHATPKERIRKLLGGSNAGIFKDAARLIQVLENDRDYWRDKAKGLGG